MNPRKRGRHLSGKLGKKIEEIKDGGLGAPRWTNHHDRGKGGVVTYDDLGEFWCGGGEVESAGRPFASEKIKVAKTYW